MPTSPPPSDPPANLDARLAAHASQHHGVITRAEALALGARPEQIKHRLKTGLLEPMARGIYRHPAVAATWEQGVYAACCRFRAFASHRSAGALWMLDGIGRGRPEVTTQTQRHRSGGDVLVHRVLAGSVPAHQISQIAGIPVSDASRTILELARVVDEERLEVALDAALRRRLTSVAKLRWMLDERDGRGRAGIRRLRHLLDVRGRGPVPESALETLFARLQRRGLPPAHRQFHVRVGRTDRYIDFAWPEVLLGVETDGYSAHGGFAQVRKDLERDNGLRRFGWTILRFSWDQVVRERRRVEQEVLEAYRALQRRHPVAPT